MSYFRCKIWHKEDWTLKRCWRIKSPRFPFKSRDMTECISTIDYLEVFSYLCFRVKIFPDEECSKCHAKLFVGPLDALMPSFPFTCHSHQHLTKLYFRLLEFINEMGCKLHEYSPNYVILYGSNKKNKTFISQLHSWKNEKHACKRNDEVDS